MKIIRLAVEFMEKCPTCSHQFPNSVNNEWINCENCKTLVHSALFSEGDDTNAFDDPPVPYGTHIPRIFPTDG